MVNFGACTKSLKLRVARANFIDGMEQNILRRGNFRRIFEVRYYYDP